VFVQLAVRGATFGQCVRVSGQSKPGSGLDGVVLMVGGNIPGETRVISIAIYDQVESLNYSVAHQLSATLLVIAFVVLLAMFFANRHWHRR